jgi:hypothetical protein
MPRPNVHAPTSPNRKSAKFEKTFLVYHGLI